MFGPCSSHGAAALVWCRCGGCGVGGPSVAGVIARIRAGAFALGLLLAPSMAEAQLLSRTIAASEIAATLQNALGPTRVHLHNLGALTGGSYHAANASSIKVPATISGTPGQRTFFTLPDASTTILGRRYGYYVDHVRSTGVFVTAGADTFTISITLASTGPALVGTCVRLKSPAVPCATLGEGVMPAVEWRDARIDVVTKPIVVDRSLALDVQTVSIGGAFDIGNVCEWRLLGTRLCTLVNHQSQRLRQRVTDQVKTSLNTPEMRSAVALGVRKYLDTDLNAPLLGVRRVSMQNGQLAIALALGR